MFAYAAFVLVLRNVQSNEKRIPKVGDSFQLKPTRSIAACLA